METNTQLRIPPDHTEPLRFLRALYGTDAPGHLVLWTLPSTQSVWFPAEELEQATRRAVGLGTAQDVYFGVGLQRTRLGSRQRGKGEGVIAIPGLWADTDVAYPGRPGGPHPPTKDEALALASEFPLPATAVVDSEHGLQCWWLFRELWVFTDAEQHAAARDLSRRFQATLQAKTQAHSWSLDNTSDLARVLRLPGTWNRKFEPVPVRLLGIDEDRRYNPQEFEQYLLDSSLCPSSAPRDVSTCLRSEFPPADIQPIMEECAWLRHCHDDAATLPEPEWYAMLSILARCENAGELAHEWSEPYPRYSAGDTTAKLRQALDASGPRTCRDIRSRFDERWCADCFFYERDSSPIMLGVANHERPPERSVETARAEALRLAEEATKTDCPTAAIFADDRTLRALALVRQQDAAGWALVKSTLKDHVNLNDLQQAVKQHISRLGDARGDDGRIPALQEDGQGYRKRRMTGNDVAPEVLSNFTISVRERLFLPGGTEVLAADVSIEGGAPRRMDLPHEALLS